MSDRYYPKRMTQKPPAPSDIADKFMLRLPDGMRERLKVAASANNRSMNAEIVARLEDSFETQELLPRLNEFLDKTEEQYKSDHSMIRELAQMHKEQAVMLEAFVQFASEAPIDQIRDVSKALIASKRRKPPSETKD